MTNVLLITIDSLRADHVGCYGYERPTSPNIDRYANSGDVYENAFVHACFTRASFPALLTSSYPLMYGGYHRLSEDRTLISEVLSDEGYTTAGFHSNLYLSDEFGHGRGFDEFYDSKTDSSFATKARQYVKNNLDRNGILYNTLEWAYEFTERNAGVEVGSYHTLANDLTDMAIDWIDQTDPEQPQFLWAHYMDVHHPYIPPAEHQLEFRDDVVDEEQAIKLRRKMLERPNDITDEELQTIIDLYDAEIRFADEQIDLLVQHAKSTWEGDTLVVVTSDHGEAFDEHDEFAHRTDHFYDEVIHVPLIMDGGRDVSGGRYDELVGWLDVAPTIADYTGAGIPDEFYGSSLRSLVSDGDWNRTSVISEWGEIDGENAFSYRTSEWKYIDREGQEELFDLTEDPHELENVAEEYPEHLAELRSEIEDHKQAIRTTDTAIEDVTMDESTKQRLRNLGYTE